MRSDEFWVYFDTLREALRLRANTFATIFQRLDRLERPVVIIETGCTRQPGNWGGDGNSTVLFDRYAGTHPGSKVFSVDIDPGATAACRALVSECVTIHTGDSVGFLRSLADCRTGSLEHLDLVYRLPGALFLGYLAGRPAGCAGLTGTAKHNPAGTAEVKRLYVRPAHRGQGVARGLMLHLHQHAERHGIRRLVLDVLPSHTQVIAFYRRLGYAEADPADPADPAGPVSSASMVDMYLDLPG